MNNELYHYGVPGMKWGHRKARPTYSTLRDANGKQIRSADSARTQRLKKKAADTKRAMDYYRKEAKKANGDRDLEKIANTFAKDNAKLQTKLIKSQYRDQYNNGRSAASKAINKMLGADRTYGDVMYDYQKNRNSR